MWPLPALCGKGPVPKVTEGSLRTPRSKATHLPAGEYEHESCPSCCHCPGEEGPQQGLDHGAVTLEHAGYSCAQKSRGSGRCSGAPIVTYTCPKPLPELPSVRVGGQVKPMQQASPSRYQHRDIKSHVTLKGDVRTMGERSQKALPRGPLIHASVPACHFSSDPAKEQAPSSKCPLNTFHLIPSPLGIRLPGSPSQPPG